MLLGLPMSRRKRGGSVILLWYLNSSHLTLPPKDLNQFRRPVLSTLLALEEVQVFSSIGMAVGESDPLLSSWTGACSLEEAVEEHPYTVARSRRVLYKHLCPARASKTLLL